jgi:hypothetical protein
MFLFADVTDPLHAMAATAVGFLFSALSTFFEGFSPCLRSIYCNGMIEAKEGTDAILDFPEFLLGAAVVLVPCVEVREFGHAFGGSKLFSAR